MNTLKCKIIWIKWPANSDINLWISCEMQTNEMKMWSSQLCLRLKQSQLSPKNLHYVCMSAVHIIIICFIPFTGTMNSTNWLLPTYRSSQLRWCSTAALTRRPWVRLPLKPRKHFFGLNCDCLNRKHNFDDHILVTLTVTAR